MNERHVLRKLVRENITKELLTSLGIKTLYIKQDFLSRNVYLHIHFLKSEKIDTIEHTLIHSYLKELKVKIRKEKISKILS